MDICVLYLYGRDPYPLVLIIRGDSHAAEQGSPFEENTDDKLKGFCRKALNFTLQGSVLVLSEWLDLHSASPANVLCTASRQSSAPRNLRRRFQRSNIL
jgi:hypothetical protein